MSRYQSPSSRYNESVGLCPSGPGRQGSYSSSYDEPSYQQPRSYQDEEPLVRCSTCGQELAMHALADHVCERRDERRRPSEGLRVDVTAAGSRGAAYGANLSARSPMYPGHLDPTPPHTPNSRPASPSGYQGNEELSRSVSSVSSTSSNGSKLPFFEKYKNMVGNNGVAGVAGIGSGGMSRSQPSDNLAHPYGARGALSPGAPSPGWAPSSASPTPFAPNFPSRTSPITSERPRQRVDSNANSSASQPSPSQTSFRSDSRPQQETPASSIRSNTPPRSRKVSVNDRGAPARPEDNEESELAYDREDNRRTITGSQSTPAHLASYAPSNPALQPRRPQHAPPTQQPPPARNQPSQPSTTSTRPANPRTATGGSASSATTMTRSPTGASAELDACLEDLRIMTESGDEETDDRRLPRPPAALPHSHSSPTLTSRTAPSPINGSSLANEGRTAPLAAPAERCTTCRKGVSGNEMQKGGDGHVFCRSCYAERFLPDCRRCRRKIEGGAVTSSDGKVAGKYHPKCFTCWECSASFAGAEFYVFDQRPYCQQHWHALNGSLCANPRCGSPIEGPCVSLVGEENGGGGRYHPEHFGCSTCSEPLPEHHFVVNGLPYCERHSQGPPPTARPRKAGQQEPAAARARKRQTIITRR